MRFGVNSLLFTDTFIERDVMLLEKARKMGFDVLEITPIDPSAFPARKVRDAALELGMGVNVNFALPATANTISTDAANRRAGIDLSKHVVDLCVEAGAEVYCGANYCSWKYFTGKRRSEDEWQWAVEAYREIAEHAADSNLVLAVETLNRFESHFMNTAADALRFVNDVDMPNVKVHLDTFHMIREEDDIATAIRACKGKIGYFHACGSQRGLPGNDMVPWRECFEALRDAGYDDCITFESFHPDLSIAPLAGVWRHYAESPEVLATRALAFLKELVPQVYSESARALHI